MQLAQDMAKWWAVVYTLTSTGIPQKAKDFLIRRTTISVSKQVSSTESEF